MMFLYAFSVVLLTNHVSQCVNIISDTDKELIIASSIGDTAAVLQLITNGAHVNAYDNNGMTALHWAAENGHAETAKMLIDIGAKINAKDFFLNTPLHIACSHDHFNVIKLLLEKGADISEINLMTTLPLELCTVKDRLKPLLTQMRAKGIQFISAIRNGDIQLASQFIARGVNVNIKCSGRTALYEAIMNGQKEFAAWLVTNEANVYEISPEGSTLFELAESKGMQLPQAIDRAEMINTAEKHLHKWLQETPPLRKIEKQQKQNGHSLTWQAYHRFNDIIKFLMYLSMKYPQLCNIQCIGESHEGRPLIVLRVSNGNPKNKAIWIDGGIHAREWISPAAVTYVANDLVRNWSKQPAHIQNLNWYILAVHNPDGYEYSHENGNRLWRKNRNKQLFICSGVDLNRNYGYRWGDAGFIGDPCDEEYGGTHPFSEPETEAVRRFFNKTNEVFTAFLTFHSFGQCVLYPLNTDYKQADRKDLVQAVQTGVQQMKLVNNQIHTIETDKTLYLSPGSSESWARSTGIEYAYTIELRDKGRYGFLLPPNQIDLAAREAQAFIWTITQKIFQDVKKGNL